MELRERLSNQDVRDKIAFVEQVLQTIRPGEGPAPPVVNPKRSWRLADRLGPEVVEQLRRDRAAGAAQQELADRYDISLSSVKRILRKAH